MRTLTLLICIGISSCTGYQYVSPPAYVPMNVKKGDLKINLSTTHLQLGYAFDNNFSLFATGYLRHRDLFLNLEGWGTKEGGGANSYRDKSHQINGGLSYFRGNENFRYEIQLGGGAGATHYNHKKDIREGYNFDMRARLSSLFLQPSITFKVDPRERSQFALFTKLSSVRYDDLQVTTLFGQSVMPNKQDAYFLNKNSGYLSFAEPGLCFRVGSGTVKWNSVMSLPVLFNEGDIRYRKFNLSMSMLIALNTQKK